MYKTNKKSIKVLIFSKMGYKIEQGTNRRVTGHINSGFDALSIEL